MSGWAWAIVVFSFAVLISWLERAGERKRAARAAKKAARKAAKQAAEPAQRSTGSAASAQTTEPISSQSQKPPDEVAVLGVRLASSEAALAAARAELAMLQKRLSTAKDLTKHWHKLYRHALEGMESAKSPGRKVEGTESTPSRPDSQFRRLRALIVRELHPDHAPADSIDRAVRAEIFKVIWPKIEAITSRV